MERLTKRIREYVYHTKGKYEETLAAECTGSDVRTILNRLADYEDTGFDPQEIQKLADAICAYGKIFQGLPLTRIHELVQADREGKVILRKTKEGSKVYIILLGRIFPFDVISATWNSKNAVYEAEHGKYLRYMFNDADIGISVFLTREEAEAALERMEGEEK